MFLNLLQYDTLLLQLHPLDGSLDFVQHNLGEPVSEETFTHSHRSWSSIIPYLLSSIFYDPWHPPCSVYVPDSLFPQSFSKFSLVYYLLARIKHNVMFRRSQASLLLPYSTGASFCIDHCLITLCLLVLKIVELTYLTTAQ